MIQEEVGKGESGWFMTQEKEGCGDVFKKGDGV